MRSIPSAVIATVAIVLLSFAPAAGASKLLRFPNVWHDRIVFSYAGDLWTVGTQGGTATRLTSAPGVELFGKFSPMGASSPSPVSTVVTNRCTSLLRKAAPRNN